MAGLIDTKLIRTNLTEANFTRANIGSARVYKVIIEGVYPPQKKNKLLSIMQQKEAAIDQLESLDLCR